MSRSCADDNQIPVLPASRDGVQGREARRNTGKTVCLLHPLETVQCAVHGISDIHISASHIALNGIINVRLRLLDEFVHLVGLVEGLPKDAVAHFNKVTLDGFLLKDFDVVFNVSPRADLRGKGSEPSRSADFFKCSVCTEALRHGHHIDGAALFEERRHGGEDEPELRVVEALFFQRFHRQVHAVFVHHHCADDGFFHLGCLGRNVADFGRCHLNRINLCGLFSCVVCHDFYVFLNSKYSLSKPRKLPVSITI